MKTASFIVKFILALVIIVILFFVAVAGIGIYKGMTTL